MKQDDEDELTRLSNSDDPTVLSTDQDATRLSGTVSSSWPSGEGQRLEADQEFGPYKIIKLLGHGGMGEVYEAVHIETGRRVALKLLRGMMNQREDRARFLSEGRLAASISHPHTVYIFGSEEVDGMPVISMQLLPGGTLKDRVVERGPLPPAEAVAAILNVIGGLDAAASAGILHRDIKPSNCFVDVDGSVKVGDFGLSISTSGREAQGNNKGFQGTPQYAPPEQLRGEALDVRADIYAVGATLFYLVTGRAPFESRDFQQLVDQVKNTPAPLAHKVRAEIPAKLGLVIARCLAKTPAERPATYADLARALRPFSGGSVPARRGVRIVAGAIDLFLLWMPSTMMQTSTIRTVRGDATATADAAIWPIVLGIAYFGLSEAIWSTTVGKRICGLRVVSVSGALTWRQALGRAVLYYAPRLPIPLLVLVAGLQPVGDYLSAHWALAAGLGSVPLLGTPLLFVTMRRKNGLAAVHDLLTGTRVVQRRLEEFRSTAAVQSESASIAPDSGGTKRFGTFEVGRLLGEVPGGRLFEGIDTVLRRRVWLVESAPGAAEVPRVRRDVDRVGRLHWLAGRRGAEENWDAFEAPAGAPVDPTAGASPWSSVQGWLNDIATELAAAQRDSTTPELALNRLWIRPDGRAVLLDFPAPGRKTTSGVVSEKTTPDVVFRQLQLLLAVGRLSLANKTGSPMPVSAVAMLDRWTKKQATLSLADAQADLAGVSISADRVTRGRRLTPILISAAPVIIMLIISVVAVRTMSRTLSPRMMETLSLLGEIDKETPDHQRAIEIYLAGTRQPELLDEAAWKLMTSKNDDKEVPRLRARAREAAALQPAPADVAAAEEKIRPTLDKITRKNTSTNPQTVVLALLLVGAGMSFFGGLGSVILRPSGFVMSALGLAVVAKSGREISRFRAVLRLLVAWSPMLALGALVAFPQTRWWVMGSMVPAGIAVGLMTIGLVWSVLRPTRGPHDIAAGTTIGVR